MIRPIETVILDSLIIGGGPAGLNAALLLARARRRIVVVDAGAPRNAAAKTFHGFIGRDGTDPRCLQDDSRAELANYGVELVEDTVVSAEPLEDKSEYRIESGFVVGTASGRRYIARKLLFATGVCDELPRLAGAEACHGTSLHHCPYCDGWEHRDQVLLAYGRDAKAAAGLALSLRGWSERVIAVTDGSVLADEDRERLSANGISWREEKIVALVHVQGTLSGIRFHTGDLLAADAMFYNTNQQARCELPQKLGCAADESGRAETSEKQKTDHPGVFVAGDASGNVQLVIVAAAEGATAALAINRELQDEDRAQAEQIAKQRANAQRRDDRSSTAGRQSTHHHHLKGHAN